MSESKLLLDDVDVLTSYIACVFSIHAQLVSKYCTVVTVTLRDDVPIEEYTACQYNYTRRGVGGLELLWGHMVHNMIWVVPQIFARTRA